MTPPEFIPVLVRRQIHPRHIRCRVTTERPGVALLVALSTVDGKPAQRRHVARILRRCGHQRFLFTDAGYALRAGYRLAAIRFRERRPARFRLKALREVARLEAGRRQPYTAEDWPLVFREAGLTGEWPECLR